MRRSRNVHWLVRVHSTEKEFSSTYRLSFTWTVAPDPFANQQFALVEDQDAEADFDKFGN